MVTKKTTEEAVETVKTEEVKSRTRSRSKVIGEELARPFGSDVLKKLSKGGTNLTYVPVSEVIARLNLVLGIDGWQEIDSEVYRDATNPRWVIAKVTLAVRTEQGDWVLRHGYGGSEVKYKKGTEDPLDLGDDFKGAHSDAYKKAAQQLGVGLDIARSEEAIQAEQVERQRIEEDDHPLISEEELTWLKGKIEGLDDTGKADLRKFWTAEIPYALGSGKLTTAHLAKVRSYFNE